MHTEYKASRALCRFIKEHAPAHVAVADAPSTFRELRDWRENATAGEPIPVYDGGCIGTIYRDPEVNHAFRAMHDTAHIHLWADFGPMGERRVAELHQRQAKRAGLTGDDLRALWFDTWGQYAYYMARGRFIENQARYVGACMARGLDAVLESGELF